MNATYLRIRILNQKEFRRIRPKQYFTWVANLGSSRCRTSHFPHY